MSLFALPFAVAAWCIAVVLSMTRRARIARETTERRRIKHHQ